MTEERKTPENKPSGRKFNYYWIYGILFIVFLALSFLPKGSGQVTSWNEVRDMAIKGDVKKLVLVNDRMVEVFLTQEASQQKSYSNAQKKDDLFGQTEPNFSFEIEKGFFNNEFQIIIRTNLSVKQFYTF